MARAKQQAAALPPVERTTKVPFIRESLDDVTEPKPAPEGEYDLRIHKAKLGETKKGAGMITCTIAFDDGTEAPPFQYYLLGWDDNTPDDQIEMRKIEAKRFCAAFDVPEDFDEGDLPGQTARCFVGQEEGNDGIMRNRLRLPRLKD